MKIKIDTEKRVRLTSFQYSFPDWFIEGKNVKEVINKLMLDPTYLNYYVEAYPNCKFKLYEYEIGKLPHGCTQWNFTQAEQKEKEDDLKRLNDLAKEAGLWDMYTKTEKFMPVYFNQKLLLEVEQVEELIKKHRGYRNFQKLVKEVQKVRNENARSLQKQQEKIRKENDIFTLAKMMKNNKDFRRMLKEASKLQNVTPDLKLEMISPEALGAYQQSVFNTLPKGEAPVKVEEKSEDDEKKG